MIATDPEAGVDYLGVLRKSPAFGALLGIFIGLVSFVVLFGLVAQFVVWLFWLGFGQPGAFADYWRAAAGYHNPWGLVGMHLGIATLIPVVMGLFWLLHRVHPKWVISVLGRVRWRLLAVTLLLALVVINGLFLVRQSFPLSLQPQPDFWLFLTVILLTSPLQAVAEEVFFRGYLMQACSAIVARPWFAIVSSAGIFALAHGTQNLPLFLDRLAFGLLAGVLAWRTGGLEAGIAAHIVNNVFAFFWAGLMTSIAEVKAITQVGWEQFAWDIGTFALFTGLALLIAKWGQADTRVSV